MLRSVLTVGGWTMASRVLGFLRDMLMAALIGAGPISDAFFVANKLPNLFRAACSVKVRSTPPSFRNSPGC